MIKILLVEDDLSLSKSVYDFLKSFAQVKQVYDGVEGLYEAELGIYDLILLDLMLPEKNGFEVLKELREQNVDTPVLIMTAKESLDDKMHGFDIGADDYLTKPFSPREVLARMKAIFRRLKPTTTETLQEDTPKAPLVIGEIRVDEQNYEVFVRNQPIELTPKEFELLVYFMKRKDRVINRETLLERIWQYDFAGQSRIVDVHISHLRDKIEPDPKRPVYLVTVRGFGYRFQEPKR